MGDQQRGTRVYVGNLNDTVKKEDLEDEFTKYGKLNSVWVALNPPGKYFCFYTVKLLLIQNCNPSEHCIRQVFLVQLSS